MGQRLTPGNHTSRDAGFTLLELLVVLLIVGLIAAIATPSVTGSIQRAREAALAENLQVMRRAIDEHHADTGSYPRDLDTLVAARYISHVPEDPVAERDAAWQLVLTDQGDGVRDVRSRVSEAGSNGKPYSEW